MGKQFVLETKSEPLGNPLLVVFQRTGETVPRQGGQNVWLPWGEGSSPNVTMPKVVEKLKEEEERMTKDNWFTLNFCPSKQKRHKLQRDAGWNIHYIE